MNDGQSRQLFVGTWVLALIIVTWINISQKKSLPQPSQIIKTTAVFTILSVISEASPKLAGVMGLGLLIPLFLITQGRTPSQAQQSQPLTQTASSSVASLAVGGLTA